MPREREVPVRTLPNCPRGLRVRLRAVYLTREAEKGSPDCWKGSDEFDVGMHPAISLFDEVKYYIRYQRHCDKILTCFNSLYLTCPSKVSGGSPDEKRIRIKLTKIPLD